MLFERVFWVLLLLRTMLSSLLLFGSILWPADMASDLNEWVYSLSWLPFKVFDKVILLTSLLECKFIDLLLGYFLRVWLEMMKRYSKNWLNWLSPWRTGFMVSLLSKWYCKRSPEVIESRAMRAEVLVPASAYLWDLKKKLGWSSFSFCCYKYCASIAWLQNKDFTEPGF